MEAKLEALKTRLTEINNIEAAAGVLSWDQSTYMPPGGAAARARQLATLQRLAQEKLADPAIGQLLDDLAPYAASLPYDSDDAGYIRAARIKYERQTKVPAEFWAAFVEHSSLGYQTWMTARENNDFAAIQPTVEKTLDLSRQMAAYFPGYEHIADPLINFSDYGMKVSEIRPLFAALRNELVPLLQAIDAQEAPDDSCLYQRFPKAGQYAFAREAIQKFGYDFERGRQDDTHHPFQTQFSIGDVRITTRADEHHLSDGIFATMHEAGHGLYEQGINPAYEGSPLATGASSGVHESQSRLWENRVGRSRGFWQHHYPRLQEIFPEQLNNVTVDTFYAAINKVQRSLIRVAADELTYNLHVMIRFDLEIDLLEGRLAIKDLPAAWRARYTDDLGVTPPDDRDGVLQDVHWYAGVIGGAFQGYTLGNILGAQYYEAALQAHPTIPSEIERGECGTLHTWLSENIYQHGSKFTANELTERITGAGVRIEPLVNYLNAKFSDLYNL